VLQALGVRLDVPPAAQAGVLDRTGIVFLFAPLYHQALRHAATARSELGIATVFNFLGPLANPARPIGQAVGVADERMAGLMAGVLAGRGSRGMVFHGQDGLDELTTTTTSRVWVIADGATHDDVLDPATLGLAPATREDLVGGNPEHNAGVVRDVLAGQVGPVRDIVLLNAAAALLAYAGPDTTRPVGDQLAVHLAAAAEAVDSGRASALLADWAEITQNV
jgi:anthranilate phosphoribosyltransferase